MEWHSYIIRSKVVDSLKFFFFEIYTRYFTLNSEKQWSSLSILQFNLNLIVHQPKLPD